MRLVLVLLAVVGVWLLLVTRSARRMSREGAALEEGFANPSMFRFEARSLGHPLFLFGPGGRALAALEREGFTRIGEVDEVCGAARIASVLLLSSDRRTWAHVALWTLLPLGQVRVLSHFVSRTHTGVVIHTGGGNVPSGEGLVSREGGSTVEERLAVHRAALSARSDGAVELSATLDGCETLNRLFYERMRDVRAEEARARPGLSFVDGRQAALAAGLRPPTAAAVPWRRLIWMSIGLGCLALGLAERDVGFVPSLLILVVYWLLARRFYLRG